MFLPVGALVLVQIRPEFVGLEAEFALEGTVVAVLDGVLFQVPDRVEQFPAVLALALLVLLQGDVDVIDFGGTDHDGWRRWRVILQQKEIDFYREIQI